ncbi:NepR family anti-sigma factor [Rhizobium sp. ZK1]|uniref:NepR family anti-sigma factor n=1 Tax=Rhizobium sp. ZK1 TaxID=3389872 RepID=UPI0039F6D31C
MTTQKTEAMDERQQEVRASDILDPNNQIGVRLRSLYAAAQEEAIPDRFLDLLEKLDRAEMMASAKMAE